LEEQLLLRILMVEDNSADARLTGEILKDTDIEHELVWINEGEKALDRIKQDEGFDLFIIDLNLPKVSGLEVVAALRKMERYRKTPVIMMTGSISPIDKAMTEVEEDIHFMVKPMTVDEMDKTVLKIKDVVLGMKKLAIF
jgi:CheY-like chemotaxis protein